MQRGVAVEAEACRRSGPDRPGRSHVALRLALLLLAWPLAVSAPARSDAPGPEPIAFEDPVQGLRTTVLDNGLTVLTLEDPTTPVVSFQIWVRVGSGDEARWTGLAHLFEHMMFRGSKHLGPEVHQQLLEQRGARLNAYTSRDQTVYFTDVTRENLPLVIELEAERLRFLDISEKSLASERQVVLEERRLRTEDNAEGLLYEALMALTFEAHPYRVPTIGWRSDVEKVGVAQCRDFFDLYYAASNLVVAVVGDFDTDETLASIRRHLGKLRSRGAVPRNPTEEPVQRGERRAVVHYDVRAPVVAMAWRAPPTGHEDAATLDVMSVILSNGRTSRLYKRLVHEEPVALDVGASYWELAREGVVSISTSLRPGVPVARAERILSEEVERLKREPVSEAELAKAKRALEVGLISGQGTSHALASRIGRDWLAFGRVRPLSERLEAIERVRAEDVQRVATTYLRLDGRNLVELLAPPPERESPEAQR